MESGGKENKRKFTAEIMQADRGGAYVVVPFDVEQVYGKKRFRINATIDGEEYRGSLVRMGGSEHIPGILKEIRGVIGKSYGDEVEIVIEEDTTPGGIDMLQDLQYTPMGNLQAKDFPTW